MRSPLAITSSGRDSSTSRPSASIDSGLSFRPKCRSETCRTRVDTVEGGYTVRSWPTPVQTQSRANDSPEIFDDLYLGLRAGGALRKQRRGEPLTTEEQEALGRWNRLSMARKAVAVGAFALGTFGLGFTLGGLIFGRWRKA